MLKLLRLFFFDDFKVALTLFDRSIPTDVAVTQLTDYLRRRVDCFVRVVGDARVVAAFQGLPGGAGLTISDFVRLGVFESDAADGVSSAGEVMFSIFGNRPLVLEELPALKIQFNRQAFQVMSEPVEFAMAGTSLRVRTLRGVDLLAGDAPVDLGIGVRQGHFSCFALLDKGVVVSTVTLEGDVFWQEVFSSFQAETEELKELVARFERERATLEKLAQSLEHELTGFRAVDELDAELIGQCGVAKRNIFGFAGCSSDRRQDAQQWLEELAHVGLSGVFEDPRWARVLALMGTAQARLEKVSEEDLAFEGLDAASSIAGLVRFASCAGRDTGGLGWAFMMPVGDRIEVTL